MPCFRCASCDREIFSGTDIEVNFVVKAENQKPYHPQCAIAEVKRPTLRSSANASLCLQSAGTGAASPRLSIARTMSPPRTYDRGRLSTSVTGGFGFCGLFNSSQRLISNSVLLVRYLCRVLRRAENRARLQSVRRNECAVE